MLLKLLTAWCLLAITVTIHAAGLTMVLRRLPASPVMSDRRFGPVTWLLIRIAWWLMVIHLAEIVVWALFFWWAKCQPDAESAFYFSGVTYTTIGYGDLVLTKEWRLLGTLEGLTGILMVGLSTGLFFAVVSKIFTTKTEVKPG